MPNPAISRVEHPSNRKVNFFRLLDAPRELVWKVCRDPQQLHQWCGPAGFTIAWPPVMPRLPMLLVMLLGAALPSASLVAQETRPTSSARSTARAFTVTRPALISSIVVTEAEADSNSDMNEALADYEYYLSCAIPVLRLHGVEVYATTDSTIRWRDSLGVHIEFAADSGGVIYLFVLPNGRKMVLHAGVEVDDAILTAAREQFAIALP